MRILIAPTAYKGSYLPLQVAQAMQEGVELFRKENELPVSSCILPLADGGDGSIEAISYVLEGKLRQLEVSGAIGEKRPASWFEAKRDLAVLELASACGISGIKKEDLRPMEANTKGLGQLIRHVLADSDKQLLVIALGGSASTDGGSACLHELGVRFFDLDDNEFAPRGGGDLCKLKRLDLSGARQILGKRKLKLACDVDNPLLGKLGAAEIFARQKGASDKQVIELEACLSNFADLLESTCGKSLASTPGAGAAGGTAFGLAAALEAEIIPGFTWLADLMNLEEKLQSCDIVLSGEGSIDKSTLFGKTLSCLHNQCTAHSKKLILIAAFLDSNLDQSKFTDTSLYGICSRGEFASLRDISETTRIALNNTLAQ